MKQKGNEMQVTPEVQSTVLESKQWGPAVRFFIVHPSLQSSLYVLLRGGGLWGGGGIPTVSSFILSGSFLFFCCIVKFWVTCECGERPGWEACCVYVCNM